MGKLIYDVTAFTSDASQNYYAKGRLTESTYTAAEYTYHRNYGYDVFGKSSKVETKISHSTDTLCTDVNAIPCKFMSYQSFDELGRKKVITYPDGKTTDITYHHGTSVVAKIEHDGVAYAAYSNYNERSQPQSVLYGNGVTTNYTYQANTGYLNTAITKTSTNQLLKHHTYTFDGVGNVSSIDNGLISRFRYDFTYDSLNRIRTARRADGRTFNYSFDNKGNITNRDGEGLSYHANSTKLATRRYYNNSNSSHVVENYSWSAAGNMLNRGTLSTYQYDRQNMLRRVTKDDGSVAENFYDESGQRFLKTFQQTGELPIKTFFLGAGYELKEKWQHGQRRGYQATKTIFGLDNQRLATITDEPTALPIAALEKPQDYIAIAGILTFTNYTEAFTKIKLLIKGFKSEFYSLVDDATPYLPLIAILILILLYFTNLLPFKVNRDSKASVALSMCALLLFMHCRGDGSPTVYHNYNFSSIYDGLPSGVYFYVNDHIGSSSLAIDENENEVIRLHYTPYGKIDETASGVYNQTTNKLENSIAQPNHLVTATKFALHNFDPENELYYMNARYYDPLIGSFTTADTYIDGEDTFMGFNRYAYVHGNPLKYNDPTGHFISFTAMLITAAVSATVSAGANLVAQVAAGQKIDWGSVGKAFAIGAVAGGAGFAVGAVAGAGAGAVTSSGTVGTITGATVGGAAGGFTGGALTAWDQDLSSGDFWKMAGFGALAGGVGGLVAGGAIASGVPIFSAHSISSGLGSMAGNGVDNLLNGRGFFENWGASFGIGFGAAWATGIANREFNTDGEIEYDKRGRLKGVHDGDILAFTSATPSNSSNGFYKTIRDWLWSTLLGGYSHVTTVDDGRITQYGKSYEGKKYSGRNYKVIGNKGLDNLRATRIDPNKAGLNKQQRAKYYNSLTNNCTTSLAKGLGISHQWAPYNIYSHFNNAQFTWGYY